MAILIPSVIGIALTIAFVAWKRDLARAQRRPEPPRKHLWHYPSVSVIRPVRGADVGARENVAAALDTGYPGDVETIFVFDDESDPGLPIAREVVRTHNASFRHCRAVVIVAGAPPPARTGKLNAMIVGASRARGSLIAFGDSDTRPDRELLRELVETLMTTPRAGSAFAPVVIDDTPRGAGDVLYALMQNALYAPLAARDAAKSDGSLPFIMGQIMVFKREALDAICGVACADGQLVDDMYIGACVARAGYRNIMIRRPLAITNGGMALGEFWALMRRWLLFSHNGLPSAFTGPGWLRGLETWTAIALIAAGAALARPAGVLLGAVAIVASAASHARLERAFGGAPTALRHWWVTLLIPLLAPAVIVSAIFHREVTWRGRAYALDLGAHLDGRGKRAS